MIDRRAVETRRARMSLRDGLNRISSLERCRKCGRTPLGSGVAVLVRPDGRAVYDGLATCQSVWACPVCSATIRMGRSVEIESGLGRWFEDGHGAVFLTNTMPHDFGDHLAPLLIALQGSWRLTTIGRAWARLRKEFGIAGVIRALEVTHGVNGWHPHMHSLLLMLAPLNNARVDELGVSMFETYQRGMVRAGYREPSVAHGLVAKNVTDAKGVAHYTSKVQDPLGVSIELARSDLKVGRREGRSPFQLLGDAWYFDDARSLMAFREYEEAMLGRPAVRWSPGLKGRLGVVEASDAELCDEEVEAAQGVLVIDARTWSVVRSHFGGSAALLEAVESGGASAGLALVAQLMAGSIDGVVHVGS